MSEVKSEANKILEPKQFYSPDVKKVSDIISIDPETSIFLGSFMLKSQLYTGDVDIFNTVKKPLTWIKNRVQQIARAINRNHSIYFTDCKLGLDESKRLISGEAYISGDTIYHYNQERILKRLDEIKDNLSEAQIELAKKLITKKPTEKQLDVINKVLRYDIVRWTLPELARGFKQLREGSKRKGGRRLTLGKALKSKALFKIDVIALINGIYTEITCVYDLRTKNNTRINYTNFDPVRSIKSDIRIHTGAGEFFKVLKRKFSLYKLLYRKKPTEVMANRIVKLNEILNSELGQLYQIKSVLSVLFSLIDTYEHTDKDKLRASFGFIIDALSHITTNERIAKEVAGSLTEVAQLRVSSDKVSVVLADAYTAINKLLNSKAKPYIDI